MVYSADGRSLAGAAGDYAKIWNAKGKRLASFRGDDRMVHTVAFSSDGKRLAFGGLNRHAEVWDIAGKARLFKLEGHEYMVRHVAFAPDGRSIATASDDETLRIWGVEPGWGPAIGFPGPGSHLGGDFRPRSAYCGPVYTSVHPRLSKATLWHEGVPCAAGPPESLRTQTEPSSAEMDTCAALVPPCIEQAVKFEVNVYTVLHPRLLKATSWHEGVPTAAAPPVALRTQTEPSSAEMDTCARFVPPCIEQAVGNADAESVANMITAESASPTPASRAAPLLRLIFMNTSLF